MKQVSWNYNYNYVTLNYTNYPTLCYTTPCYTTPRNTRYTCSDNYNYITWRHTSLSTLHSTTLHHRTSQHHITIHYPPLHFIQNTTPYITTTALPKLRCTTATTSLCNYSCITAHYTQQLRVRCQYWFVRKGNVPQSIQRLIVIFPLYSGFSCLETLRSFSNALQVTQKVPPSCGNHLWSVHLLSTISMFRSWIHVPHI